MRMDIVGFCISKLGKLRYTDEDAGYFFELSRSFVLPNIYLMNFHSFWPENNVPLISISISITTIAISPAPN